MSVQTQQFRVVGVNTQNGEDVSVVIDAATKAAAEVKAEQMHIETTHIVRIKQETPEPPDEHELFSTEAAEALAGKRTDKLIEEVVPPEEPKPAPAPPPPTPQPQPVEVVAAVTRPTYAAPASREPSSDTVSGMRAFGLVLVVLMTICAGAYFVLVHQPNTIHAQDHDLIFGEDLFSDVLEPPTLESPFDKLERDAFNEQVKVKASPDGPPIAPDQQINLTPPETQPQVEAASAAGANQAPPIDATPPKSSSNKLKLQSIVTTHKGRFAVINGKLYKEGDAFGSAALVSVADDWVLIERDGKQFTLQIETKAAE
eukprot:g13457.t1